MKQRRISLAVSFAVGCCTAGALSLCAPPSYAEKRTSRDHAQTALPSDKNLATGIERYDNGDYDGAIDSFLQSVYFARNNYQPTANMWLGKAYMWKHEDVKAMEALKKAVEQSLGGNDEAHILLAECYLRNDKLDEAEQECYTAMAETLGRSYKAHFMLGRVYEAKNNLTAAQSQYVDALGDRPWRYTEAWMALAEVKMKQHNWVGALQEFRAMLTSTVHLHPEAPYEQVYLDMGICLVAKGDHQGAMDNWHRVLDYNEKNPEAHLQLGMLFDAENHIQSAVNEYKQFIRLSTDQKKVEKAKERIQIIQQKLTGEADIQAPQASPYLRQQQEQQARAAAAQRQQAEVQERLKNPDGAGF